MTEQSNKKDFIYKVILLGDAGVGKTSILLRYVKNQFNAHYAVTVGVEFSSKTIHIDDNVSIKIQIWDTAGQESFRALVKNFYRKSAAVFFVYNIANRKSYENIKSWMDEFRQHVEHKVIFVLIGTQSDRTNDRQVTKQQAQEFTKHNQINLFFQTSAKEGSNIDDAFEETGKQLFLKSRLRTESKQNLKVLEIPQNTNESGCCI